MYYIGIDWGLKRTGLAIADNELKIATVLPEVLTVNLVNEIERLKKELGEIVVVFGGLGIWKGGEVNKKFRNSKESEDKKRSRENEKEEIMKKIGNLKIKVVVAEEMFTTKMAQQNLLESGKKMVSKKDNSEAAKIILQSWLDIIT
jgi:RNase H-fold protein (predicted Holliday junction resolvase)